MTESKAAQKSKPMMMAGDDEASYRGENGMNSPFVSNHSFSYESIMKKKTPLCVVSMDLSEKGHYWIEQKLSGKQSLKQSFEEYRQTNAENFSLRLFAASIWFALADRVEKEIPKKYGRVSRQDGFYDVIFLDRLEQRLDNFMYQFEFSPEERKFACDFRGALIDFHHFMLDNQVADHKFDQARDYFSSQKR